MSKDAFSTQRFFLKDTIRRQVDFSLTGQSRGQPAPPLQKPCPVDAPRVPLPDGREASSRLGSLPVGEAIGRRESVRQYSDAPLSSGSACRPPEPGDACRNRLLRAGIPGTTNEECVMNRLLLAVLLALVSFPLAPGAAPAVSPERARRAAEAHLARVDPAGTRTVQGPWKALVDGSGRLLARVFPLRPAGFVAVSAEEALPPVVAYAFEAVSITPGASDRSDLSDGSEGPLLELLRLDLSRRLAAADRLPGAEQAKIAAAWAVTGNAAPPAAPLEQWPAHRAGWLTTRWSQDAPYNLKCPTDPVTGNRSLAGCPAVAMAQILNFHRSVNGVSFSDADDYAHAYAGRNYTVDDDAAARDFPSFPVLNQALAGLTAHWRAGLPATLAEAAHLVFACGAACKQVFTSQGSGTFGVDQAFNAFKKFNFTEATLLTAASPGLDERMRSDVINARPVHLAVVNPSWTSGHNLVVDGCNSDGYYHLNFGWGGTQDGWYLVPFGLPYDLTVIEGVVVGIAPRPWADLNQDHLCDASDVLLLAAWFAGNVRQGDAGGFTAPLTVADLNRDDHIDTADLALLLRATVE